MLSFNIDLACPYLRAFAHTVPAGLLFSQTSARLTPSLHSSLCSKFTFRDRLSLRPYLKEQCSPPLPLSVTFFSLTLLYSVSFIPYHLTVKKYVVLPTQIHVYSTHMDLFIVYPLARVYMPWEQKLFLLYSQHLDWCPAHSVDSKKYLLNEWTNIYRLSTLCKGTGGARIEMTPIPPFKEFLFWRTNTRIQGYATKQKNGLNHVFWPHKGRRGAERQRGFWDDPDRRSLMGTGRGGQGRGALGNSVWRLRGSTAWMEP